MDYTKLRIIQIAALVALSLSRVAAPDVAQAAHVVCGQIITSDTTLHADLTCDSGVTGLFILGHNITLDLAGFTIEGDADPAVFTSGVWILDPSRNVTIENGTVDGFQQGIEGAAVQSLTIKNLLVKGQIKGLGIRVGAGRNITIRDSSFFSVSTNPGIAIRLDDSTQVTVRNVDLHGYSSGALPVNTTHLVVTQSSFSGMGHSAVTIVSGSHVTISQNHITGVVVTAIDAGYKGPVSDLKIEDNFIHNNNRGIALRDMTGTIISGNHILDNTIQGVAMDSGLVNNRIVDNITSGNTPDLFHDVLSSPNQWVGNGCDTKVGADIPAC